MLCTETKAALISDQVYAACRENDGGRYSPLSETVIAQIPEKERTKIRRSYKTGGANICRAKVFGNNGDSHLVFDQDVDFLFSISSDTMKKFMPNAWQEFPHKPEHKK